MTMYDAENYNIGRFYLVNDQPAKANGFSVNFVSGGDFIAFTKDMRVLFNSVNGSENLVTNPNGIYWFMPDIGYITSNIINVP